MVEGSDVPVHYVTALRQTVLLPYNKQPVLGIMEVSMMVITWTQITQREKNPTLIMEPVLMPTKMGTTNKSLTLEALLD